MSASRDDALICGERGHGVTTAMAGTFFKRYRMEISVIDRSVVTRPAPDGYRLVPWEPALLEIHAQVKYRSFRDSLDAGLFACFNDEAGCLRLMRQIAARDGFLPTTTWLLCRGAPPHEPEWCGTIQGMRTPDGIGSIQNVGVVPGHRGRGLGTCLVDRALAGFAAAGVPRVYLEVTADNADAVRLYRALGFRVTKTFYKESQVV